MLAVYCLRRYVALNNVNFKSVAMETQQCVLFIVAGYMFHLILSPRKLQDLHTYVAANNMKHT